MNNNANVHVKGKKNILEINCNDLMSGNKKLIC